MVILDNIKNKIKQHFNNDDIKDDENLFLASFIDSFGLIELVVYIEKEFSIDINYEDLNEDNFSSIDSISSFIYTAMNG